MKNKTIPSKFITAHMKVAEVYAELSSAIRLKVGCVIVKDNTIIGIGYNGMPSGWDNKCEDSVYLDDMHVQLVTKPEVIHAEANALAKVTRSTNSSEGASLFVTHAPCIDCAKQIYQAGIWQVFYKQLNLKNNDGIDFLNKCNIPLYQYEP
jgi:dCMP deaminase